MSEPNVNPSAITANDIADLNRAALARSGVIARIVGSVLVGIGVLGALVWIWYELRQQWNASNGPFDVNLGTGSGPELDLADRIDLLAFSLSLLLSSAVVVGVGLVLRVFADYAHTRAGVSITGFEVGDMLDEAESGDDT